MDISALLSGGLSGGMGMMKKLIPGMMGGMGEETALNAAEYGGMQEPAGSFGEMAKNFGDDFLNKFGEEQKKRGETKYSAMSAAPQFDAFSQMRGMF